MSKLKFDLELPLSEEQEEYMDCILETEPGIADKYSLIYLLDEVISKGQDITLPECSLRDKFNEVMVDSMGYDNIPALTDTLEYVVMASSRGVNQTVGNYPFRIEDIVLKDLEPTAVISLSVYENEDKLHADTRL